MNDKQLNFNEKIFYLLFFAIILAFSRIIPHPPNFSPIIASAIMAPILLKDRVIGMIIPIIAMLISDIIIGFHSYQVAIYLTLISISLMTSMNKNYKVLALIALISSVWFFVTTNFAVWLIWDYYPKTLKGLILSYTLALPFFKNTLLSTFIFTGLIALIQNHLEDLSEKINNCITIYINKFNN